MNWISTTGLSPCAAIPTASPPSMVSASGESITRLKPKVSRKPWVARNPPPLTPTSSPSTTTFSSSLMARCIARLTASSRLTFLSTDGSFNMVGPSITTRHALKEPLSLIGEGRRPLCVNVIEHRFRGLIACAFEVIHRLLNKALTLSNQRLFARFIPHPLTGHERLQALDRLFQPGLFHLLGGAVTGGVVGGSVIAQPVAQALE